MDIRVRIIRINYHRHSLLHYYYNFLLLLLQGELNRSRNSIPSIWPPLLNYTIFCCFFFILCFFFFQIHFLSSNTPWKLGGTLSVRRSRGRAPRVSEWVCVCVCVCVCVRACVSERVWVRERHRERERGARARVCVCEGERERVSEWVCECACVRARVCLLCCCCPLIPALVLVRGSETHLHREQP